ncbi:methyltransferase [Paractinoplanes abujensis]|uniref:SAM-dependent methyltransferase n=1 Tax=Paractinoplanes abujensis TaxID=882441 RepID=A0A7W7CUU4_9ACTN|nr:class I SAM-dependent methyltransferase [Actinoplanes abujensis]MBB4695082.1 SAM-dependent methyltransferase [Actinoplanes abujensis]GID23815.1 methyltransferase [Actinoplanes abujensis]
MDDPDGYFGEAVARTYDDAAGAEFDPVVIARTADVLADLVEGGSALEFAVGTGRVAVPLAERGVTVRGIDLSRAMVARLQAKSPAVEATIGDFTTTRVEGEFGLVYLVFNTIMNVTTQDAQVECFANAAAHLRPGGRFLVEVMIPELRKLPAGQTVVPFTVTPGHWGFDSYEVATQRMASNYVTLHEDGRGDFASVPFRYLWPAEMDLMARMAGLRPEHRWDSWERTPFTNESGKIIATWVKP